MKLWAAKSIAGSLGFPSKMPGTSYGLPAKACIAGAKLAQIPGTVCATCYALGGRASYQMPRAYKGQLKRLLSIAHPQWVAALVRLLLHVHSRTKIKVDLGIVGVRLQKAGGSRYRLNDSGFHRWHDSGDLQSIAHFSNICEVARSTPRIRHWLPTQELGIVKDYLSAGGNIPSNLLVRVSSVRIDDDQKRAWPTTSSVFSETPLEGSWVCPAPQQGHMCGSCRACWSETPHISYKIH